jgi:hypothetical protein
MHIMSALISLVRCVLRYGVKVRDVLEAAGMPVDGIALRKVAPGGKIVNFIAMDADETGAQQTNNSQHTTACSSACCVHLFC